MRARRGTCWTNDDVKRLFLGEIPESLKALNFADA